MIGSDCPTQKEQFATREAAAERRDFLRAAGLGEGSLSVFRCELCGCLHVGHRGQRREVQRRRAARRR